MDVEPSALELIQPSAKCAFSGDPLGDRFDRGDGLLHGVWVVGALAIRKELYCSLQTVPSTSHGSHVRQRGIHRIGFCAGVNGRDLIADESISHEVPLESIVQRIRERAAGFLTTLVISLS